MHDAEAQALAKTWFYPFQLPSGGTTPTYGTGELDPIHHTRSAMLESALQAEFGAERRALSAVDLACHQGWFSAQLAQSGFGRVIGVDARPEHIADAGLIRDALRLPQIELVEADVHALDPRALGTHDLVLCFGLIYHLENPVGALRVARGHTRRLCLVETQLAPNISGPTDWGSYRYVKQMLGSFALVDETREVFDGNREANVGTISLFPSLEALLFLMDAVGFDRVEVVPSDGSNEQLDSGKRAMVAGWVGS